MNMKPTMGISMLALVALVAQGCAGTGERSTWQKPAVEGPPAAIVHEPKVTTEVVRTRGGVVQYTGAEGFMLDGLYHWKREGDTGCSIGTCEPKANHNVGALKRQQIEEKKDG